MSFGSFSEVGGSQPIAEINTTPLVDVMLVLLVIFIITAPLFPQAVSIDLPQVDSTRQEESPKVIQLTLDGQGELFWDGTPLPRSALAARLVDARAGKPELHLRADRATRYERVAETMAAVQAAGIMRIAFVTEAAH